MRSLTSFLALFLFTFSATAEVQPQPQPHHRGSNINRRTPDGRHDNSFGFNPQIRSEVGADDTTGNITLNLADEHVSRRGSRVNDGKGRKDLVSGLRKLNGNVLAQYYPGYNAALKPVSSMNWSLLNLAIYFVLPTSPTGLDTKYMTSDPDLLPNMKELVKTSHNNSVPIIFSVGGWSGSLYFSTLVAKEKGRKKFAHGLKNFMEKYQFDGVDIDWEYPEMQGLGCNNVSDSDNDNYLAFLKELRSQIGKDKLITAAVSAQGFVDKNGDPLKDLGGFGEVFDYITMMNYDTFGSFTNTTGPNSPLSDACAPEDGKSSANTSVSKWVDNGFPSNKLLLGIPGYGYAYETTSNELATAKSQNGKQSSKIFQKKNATQPQGDEQDSEGTNACGDFEPFTGSMLYKSLINYQWLSKDGSKGLNGFERHFDNCSSTPFLFNPNNRTFVSYDDAQSSKLKGAFSRQQKLAGMALFDSTGPTDDVIQSAMEGLIGEKNDFSIGIDISISGST